MPDDALLDEFLGFFEKKSRSGVLALTEVPAVDFLFFE